MIAAGKHFTRNVWLVLTTVCVLALALLSVNVLLGVNLLLTNAVKTLERKLDVSVYFSQTAPQAILDQAKFFMASLPQVASVQLLTADEALAAFQKRYANDPKILGAVQAVEKNPFGGTLIIKARRTEDFPFLLDVMKQNPQFNFAIESQNFENHADTIRRVREMSRTTSLFGIVLIAIFTLFSVLIVYNTVRIAIYTQREEIGVMRLVGASSAYVRWPFVLEGILLALCAALVTAGVVYVAAWYSDAQLRGFFDGSDPDLTRYFLEHAAFLSVIEGGALALLVALSSWAAVGKYLKR